MLCDARSDSTSAKSEQSRSDSLKTHLLRILRKDVERVDGREEPDVPCLEHVDEEPEVKRARLGSLSTRRDHSLTADRNVLLGENPVGLDLGRKVGDEEAEGLAHGGRGGDIVSGGASATDL